MRTSYGFRRGEARAIRSTNLSWSESGLSDIEYLTARGMSCFELGAALERLKFSQDYSVYERCVELTSDKFQRRARRPARRSLVTAALREYLNDQCVACGGRGLIALGDNASINCMDCKGGGLRNYDKAERAHAASVKLSCWAHYQDDYDVILDCLRSAAGAHRKDMTRKLADTATA